MSPEKNASHLLKAGKVENLVEKFKIQQFVTL
jgi:hypothetical protein